MFLIFSNLTIMTCGNNLDVEATQKGLGVILAEESNLGAMPDIQQDRVRAESGSGQPSYPACSCFSTSHSRPKSE